MSSIVLNVDNLCTSRTHCCELLFEHANVWVTIYSKILVVLLETALRLFVSNCLHFFSSILFLKDRGTVEL